MIDLTRVLDVSIAVTIAIVAIVQMSRAHAECRRSQAAIAERLLALIEKLSESALD